MRASILSSPLLMALSAAGLSAAALSASALSSSALAQPSAPGANTVLAPLPSPNLPPGQRPSDYLHAAQSALAAGRTGEAQEALEMAQTRMLDRSVPMGQTNNQSDNPTIVQIAQARQALAARDRATCLQLIQAAIGSATAQGL
jgi:hypothetical protein